MYKIRKDSLPIIINALEHSDSLYIENVEGDKVKLYDEENNCIYWVKIKLMPCNAPKS